jgi:hypothetical protein
MPWYLLLKFAHLVCAIALLAGLIGRGLVRRRLPQVASIPVLQEDMVLVGRFDEWLVVRGSLLTLVTGVLLGIVGQWPYLVAGHPTWLFVSLLLFLSQIPLVVFVFVPRGKAFGKVYAAALQEQQITPLLRAALADPAVCAATIYESLSVAIILALMVFKPF